MSELTLEARGGVLRTLPELEAAIGYYKRQTAEGIIGIGAALNEAKEQLGHGEWLPWLAKVQINARAAQNYMRVAREIAPGSVMAGLPYTKALALLDAPEEVREQLLDEGVEDRSAAEIRRLTKERDRALSANQLQVEKMQEMQAKLDRAAENQKQLKEMRDYYETVSREWKNKLAEMERHPKTVEVPPEDYAELKEAVETLRQQLAEAEAAAEEAETRTMGAPAEEPSDDEYTLTAASFVEACTDFLNRVQFYPYYKSDIADLDASSRRSMEIFAQGVQNWAVRMLSALASADGSVECDGAVTADV